MRTEKRKKRNWKKRHIILAILTPILLFGIGYLIMFFHSFNQTLNEIHQPIERNTEKREKEVEVTKKEPFSVLLLGVDERENDRGRSDTMIVVTVNPTLNSVKMLSIPRDTYVEIPGRENKDKINHAYAFGGVELALETVEDFLNIPIDYYIKINMEGFLDIIDALGGITLNNDMDLTHGKYHFPKGEITLTSEEALVFSRIRKEDPRGDFGRQLRQRQIIEGIVKKGLDISSLWKFQGIFEAVGENVRTNLTLQEMFEIQQNYASASKNIEQLMFEGRDGGYVGRYWYYFADEEEVAKFEEIFKAHLELDNA